MRWCAGVPAAPDPARRQRALICVAHLAAYVSICQHPLAAYACARPNTPPESTDMYRPPVRACERARDGQSAKGVLRQVLRSRGGKGGKGGGGTEETERQLREAAAGAQWSLRPEFATHKQAYGGGGVTLWGRGGGGGDLGEECGWRYTRRLRPHTLEA